MKATFSACRSTLTHWPQRTGNKSASQRWLQQRKTPHCTILSLWLNPLAGCVFLWQHQISRCPFSQSSSPALFLCLSRLVLWPCRICFGNPCLLHLLRNYLRVRSRHNTVCHRGERVLLPHWIGSGVFCYAAGLFWNKRREVVQAPNCMIHVANAELWGGAEKLMGKHLLFRTSVLQTCIIKHPKTL